jgi:serine protease Do
MTEPARGAALTWAALGLVFACTGGAAGPPSGAPSTAGDRVSVAPPPPPGGGPPTAAPGLGGPDFAAAFAAVSPSVVGVVAGRREGDRLVAERTGSGFVWDASGHVVTNDHLVGESRAVAVRLEDGRALAARVKGRDASTDLAVLHVMAAGLNPAPRGNADGLLPGTWVAAIGNPMGMDHSITVGVVSATGRHGLPGARSRYLNFIQTDVNLNPGNSGGPLVDGRGVVVGLNTAVLDRTQGIAFATPIDLVETVVRDILENGRFIRGFAGIVVKPVRLRDATEAGLGRQTGARVEKIVPDGPGDAAGLLPGDIILRFGPKKVDDAAALPWLIAQTRPGTSVELRVARGPQRLVLVLTVAQVQ